MAAHINWEAVRAEYISDAKSTYRSLGEKYGVSPNAISVRSRGENWREQRRRRSEDVSRKIIEAQTRSDVERFAQVSSAAQSLIDQIELAVNDKDQFYRYIVTSVTPEPDGSTVSEKSERIFSKMDTKALRELTASLREALEILRRANRIPTVEQQMNYELALKRFEFERERFASGDDRAVQITFDDELGAMYTEEEGG